MKLSNGRCEIELDERTGSLVRIRDSATGIEHLNSTTHGRADGSLFRIMIPHTERFSRRCDSQAQKPPAVRREGGAVVLKWENLQVAGEGMSGVSAEVRIAPGGADEFRLELSIVNSGPDDVLDVWFPVLGGWTGLGGKGKDTMILGAYTEWNPHGFPYFWGTTYARVHQRQSIGYPAGMYAPWADLSGPGGGISYILYDPMPRNGFVACENLAGYDGGPIRLVYGWVSQTVVPPGARWSSAPVGIGVHGGDWHATADRYRQWMDTWWQAPPTQPSLRESIGFQNVMFRGFDGEPFRELSALPEVAAAGRRYGVDHLSVWDYVSLGNYCKHSDRDVLDFTPAEKAALTEGLRRAKAEGTNVNALTNFRLVNPNSTLFRKHAHAEVTRDQQGNARVEAYPATHFGPGALFAGHLGPSVHVCSPHAASYRARVMGYTQRYAALGFTSMFYDQPFEFADFSRLADACSPERTQAAQMTLVAEVRRRLHEIDPQAYLIGEYCDAFTSQHIDLWMSWYPRVEMALRSAYSLPRPLQSWVVDNDAGQASHAFALGLQLCLCTRGCEGTLADVPAFGEHVSKLAKLKHRLAPWLAGAQFRDHDGLEVTATGDAVGYRFNTPRGPVVIAAAPAEGGTLRAHMDAGGVAGPGQGAIHTLDGQSRAAAGADVEIALGRHDVAVWIPG